MGSMRRVALVGGVAMVAAVALAAPERRRRSKHGRDGAADGTAHGHRRQRRRDGVTRSVPGASRRTAPRCSRSPSSCSSQGAGAGVNQTPVRDPRGRRPDRRRPPGRRRRDPQPGRAPPGRRCLRGVRRDGHGDRHGGHLRRRRRPHLVRSDYSGACDGGGPCDRPNPLQLLDRLPRPRSPRRESSSYAVRRWERTRRATVAVTARGTSSTTVSAVDVAGATPTNPVVPFGQDLVPAGAVLAPPRLVRRRSRRNAGATLDRASVTKERLAFVDHPADPARSAPG